MYALIQDEHGAEVELSAQDGDTIALLAVTRPVDGADDGAIARLDRDAALRLMLALADFVRNS